MENEKHPLEVMQGLMHSMSRPRTTYWSPLGHVNTYYHDTKTWEKPEGRKFDFHTDYNGNIFLAK